MIVIDGSEGEGGGQVLRSCLSLALLTGREFHIHSIRGRREKPGLKRQHLVCIEAAAAIGTARVDGASVDSREVVFRPGKVRGGVHHFPIGTAGSTSLVLQTLLLPLLLANEPSTLAIEGGTHNPLAPPYPFLEQTFLPILRKMGARVATKLVRPGFFPAGGGRIEVAIEPSTLASIDLVERGEWRIERALAYVANLPLSIAERELAAIRKRLAIDRSSCHVEATRETPSPGNFVTIDVRTSSHVEVFTGFGERRKSAEWVANEAVDQVRAFLGTGVPVSEHLADQLLLPFAVAGGGSFLCGEPSEHARTNAAMIERFLPVRISFDRDESTPLPIHRCRVVRS